MKGSRQVKPVCHVVAGPNGAGKSTFALDYLPEFAGSIEYVNPDLMAQGLSPTDITLSSLKAGKLTLKRIRHRVLSGGHDVPTPDVLRRYARSVANLRRYAGLADILRVFDAIEAYRDTGEMVPTEKDGKLVFLTVDEALRTRDDYERRRRESGDWRLKNLLDQFAAEGLSVTPDVWDRLEADRRQALEDDLAWIARGRQVVGKGTL